MTGELASLARSGLHPVLVDALMLAQAFELSGASIKNAALHGALLAASEGVPVGMKHLLGGIENEYGKQGKNFSTSQRELLEAFL